MRICSVCNKESDKEPTDFQTPVVCSDCDPRNYCRGCSERIKGYHTENICFPCLEIELKKKRVAVNLFKVIDNTKVAGTEMNNSHYKQLNSRVIDDSGNTLSGKQGVEYMKSKGDQYATRLKEFYK